MDRVLLFGGTTEGRELARFLERYQVPAHVCVATEYGESLLEESVNGKPADDGFSREADSGQTCSGFQTVQAGRLDEEEMKSLMADGRFSAVVDATHPYASAVTRNIRSACESTGTDYLRLEREEEAVSEDCIRVSSVREAVEYLKDTEGNILVTTGSKELKEFTELPDYQDRIFARVLSTEESVTACAGMGIQGKHLICMQGPFEEALNTALLKHVHAKWMVTKESGGPGGFTEKLRSAASVGAKSVVIGRPGACLESSKETIPGERKIPACDDMEIRRILCRRLGISTKRQIAVIGIGMGNPGQMTGEALEACRRAQLLVGASRMLETAGDLKKPIFCSYRAEEIRTYVSEHPEYERVAVLLSGDVGFYSGAKELYRVFQGMALTVYPGISSVAYLCAKTGTPWEDVKLMSLHGREQNLISAVVRYRKVFALIGKKDGVRELCRKLLHFGLEHVKLTVGERMSYPEERILCGTPGELERLEFDALCAVLICNGEGHAGSVHGIPDELFLRGKVPMTKSEVRSVSISRLGLERDSVVYDVGAGTGSVAIEMAVQAWDGRVYAVEKNPEAVELLAENRKKFRTDQLEIIEGTAPEALQELPAPTHVFIGGSSGNLKAIMELALKKNPAVRIVINAIALETAAEALECLKSLPVADTDIVTVTAARAKAVGAYHMMMGQNPVYVISCAGRGGYE